MFLFFLILYFSSLPVYAAREELSIQIREYSETNGVLSQWKEIQNAAPGDNISKIVEVENNGTLDAEVKMQVEIEIYPEITVWGDAPEIGLDIDRQNWTEEEEEFYYQKVLHPGESTSPLFTTVEIPEEYGNEYADHCIYVKVRAEAVSESGEIKSQNMVLPLAGGGKIPRTGDINMYCMAIAAGCAGSVIMFLLQRLCRKAD